VLVEAGMSSVMPPGSILFEHAASKDEREDLSTFHDLNLDRVSAAVAAGRDAYDLVPFFRAPLP
jgi:hypothetical protein